jgi:hypothetical protein
MPYKDPEKRVAYAAAWHIAHRERELARMVAWRERQDLFVANLKARIRLNNRLNQRDQEVLDAHPQAKV